MAEEAIRLLIADDEELVRAGLRLLLDGADGLSVVGEAGDGEAALKEAARLRPDVVLMDIRMPGVDGVTALRRWPVDGPAVLMLTAFDTREDISAALRAGARGFLRKSTDPAGLVTAIHSAARGQAALNPEVLTTLLGESGGTGERDLVAALSGREKEIAGLVAEGLSNEAIAARVHLALPTVKTYVSRVMTKLAAENRVQVAVIYLRGSQ